jgi:hypothetical protein
VSGLGVRLRLCVSRPTKLLDPPVQSPSLRLAHAKDGVVEGARGRRHFGNTVLWTSFRLESASAVLPQLLLRDLQRQRMACLPRVSIEIYGRCPAPGPPVSHGDFRLGLAAKDARAGAPTAAPFPPPAPAGSVRCWRRAGLPRAVMRVCKEKCAIPDLEESVALNSLVPLLERPCALAWFHRSRCS